MYVDWDSCGRSMYMTLIIDVFLHCVNEREMLRDRRICAIFKRVCLRNFPHRAIKYVSNSVENHCTLSFFVLKCVELSLKRPCQLKRTYYQSLVSYIKTILIYCSIKIPRQNYTAQKLLGGMFVSRTVFHKLNNYYLFLNKDSLVIYCKKQQFLWT